jgi:AcrR family transcriptional regulator
MGRPREFDLDTALGRAMEVFWRHGYEGASLADLTAAMGINRPSLYAAFGDKKALFRKCLDRYASGPAGYVREALNEPTCRSAVEQLLRGSVERLTDPKNPPGCLAVHGALACGADADCMKKELAARRRLAVDAVRARFEQGVKAGELPAGTDCAALAGYFATVLHGLSVQASGGVGRKELERVVEVALRAWPGKNDQSAG